MRKLQQRFTEFPGSRPKQAQAKKGRRARLLAAATAVASLSSHRSGLAATVTWSGATNNNWSNVGNWVGGTTYAGSISTTTDPDVAYFNTNPTNKSPVFDMANFNLAGFTFDAGAGAYTVGTNAGNAVLLSSGGNVTVTSADTAAQIVAAPITLENAASSASGAYSFFNSSTTSAANLTISGNITGAATAGSTSLTFGGIRYTTATADVVSGVIADGLGGGNVAVTVGSGWGYLLAGPPIGSGLTLGGSDANWQFSNNDTFSGPLTISAGALQLTGTTSSGTLSNVGSVTVDGNGVFVDGSSTAASNNGVTNRVNSAAGLTLGGGSGAGTFTLAAAAASNTDSQSLASLTVGAGQNTVNANVTTGTNTLTFSGAAGSVYIRNTNGLVNFNDASGLTTVFTHAPTGASVSGSSAPILIGATLNGSDFVSAASGTIAAPTYTTNGATSLTAGANINITGGSTTLASSTTLSVNSLRFPDSTADTLALGSGSILTDASGGILVPSSVTANGANSVISGGMITSGQGDLWIYSASGTTGSRSGTANGNPRAGTDALTISSVIADNGSPMALTVGGNGFSQVLLSGVNTYSGGTFLENGLVVISADSGLGASAGAVTAISGVNSIQPTTGLTFNSSRNFVIDGGAVLQFGDDGQTNILNGQISGSGELEIGFVSSGERLILTGNNSGFTGRYDVNGFLRATEGTGLSSNANLNLAGRGAFGAGIVETSGNFIRSVGFGAGQVEWSSTNAGYSDGGFAAYGGSLTVNLGGSGTPVTLTQNSGGFLTGNSYLDLQDSVANGSLIWSNPINNNGAALNVLQGYSSTASAEAVNMTGGISGSGGFNKYGAGLLTLSGSSTYAGQTQILNGAISVSSLNYVTSGSFSGHATGSNLGDPSTTANGLILIGNAGTTTNLTYTGAGETTDRTIQVGSNSATPAAGDTGGGTLENDGSGPLTFTAATFNTANTGVIASTARVLTLQGSNTGANTIQGVIQNNTVGASGTGAVALTKAGAGNWTLSGTNTYAGNTTVTTGTLQIGGSGQLGAGSYSGTIANAGIFEYSSSAAQTFAGVISGAGQLLKDTSSTSILSLLATNTYTGNTAISAGTLQISGSGQLGSGAYAGAIADAGTLEDSSSAAQTFSGTITGTGGVTKDTSSSSTLTISASNTFSGASTVSAGTLDLSNQNALLDSTLTMAGGTLVFDSSVTGKAFNLGGLSAASFGPGFDIALQNNAGAPAAVSLTVGFNNTNTTYAGALSGSAGTLTKTGTGNLTLSGSNSYTGLTTVSAGTLVFTGNNSLGSSTLATDIAIGNTTTAAVVTLSGSGILTIPGSTAGSFIGIAVGTTGSGGAGLGILNIQGTSQLNLPTASGNGTTYGTALSVGTTTGGVGAVLQSGGNVSIDQSLLIGTAGAGYYSLSGGNLTLTAAAGNSATRFRLASDGTGDVAVFQMSGGNLNITGTVGYGLGIVDAAGGATGATDPQVGYGTFYATAGNFTASTVGATVGNRGGQGDLTVGGTASVSFSGNTILLGDTAANAVGIVNLDGGILQTGNIATQVGAGSSYVNFNGGTLRAGSANTAFLAGLTSAVINGAYTSGNISYAGGATIDTNGQNVTIAQSLVAPAGSGVVTSGTFTTISGLVGAPYVLVSGTGTGATAQPIFNPSTGQVTGITVTNPGINYTGTPAFNLFGGGISGTDTISGATVTNASGGLTKINTGTLTLTGSNSYAGNTVIAAGAIRADNATGSATGSGNVTAAAGTSNYTGGVLGGNGTVSGSVTLTASSTAKWGGIIAAGANSTTTGTLTTAGSQAWGGGSAYQWKIASPGTGAQSIGSGGSGTAGTTATWDLVSMAGLDVSTAGGSNPPITLDISNTATLAATNGTYSWTIASTSSPVSLPTGVTAGAATNLLTTAPTGGASDVFALDTTSFTINGSVPSPTSSAFTLEFVANGGGGDNLVLDYSASPEPGTALLFVGGMAPLLSARRRRRGPQVT